MLKVLKSRLKETRCRCTDNKRNQFLRLNRPLNEISYGVFHNAQMQETIYSWSFLHLVRANMVIPKTRTLETKAVLWTLNQLLCWACLAFCDASRGSWSYVQTRSASRFLLSSAKYFMLPTKNHRDDGRPLLLIGEEMLSDETFTDWTSLMKEGQSAYFRSKMKLSFV